MNIGGGGLLFARNELGFGSVVTRSFPGMCAVHIYAIVLTAGVDVAIVTCYCRVS
jgi:uncharacterized MnhB-related membrane protein